MNLSPNRGEIKDSEDLAKIQLSTCTKNKLAALKQIFAVNIRFDNGRSNEALED